MSSVGGVASPKPGGSAIGLIALLVVSTLASLSMSTARGAVGGPDLCGYEWTDNAEPPPNVNFTWIDIVPNGTRIIDWNVSADDGYAGPIPLGFAFTFYDSVHVEAFIETNGYVGFGQGAGWAPGGPIPSPEPPNNYAAAYGADLNPSAADGLSGVYYETLSNPNRFVIEYYQIPHAPDYDPVTFEIILHETGEILFQYLDVTSDAWIVGLEGADGTVGLSYVGELTDGRAIGFAPPATPSGPVAVDLHPCNRGVLTIPGATEDLSLTVTNAGTAGTDTFDLVAAVPTGWDATFYQPDGTTPLNDTDGDLTPDTGALAPSEKMDVLLRVEVPSNRLGDAVLDITATSSVDANVSDRGHGSFLVVQAIFAPPHADFGNDTDGDGQFDLLQVDVDIVAGLAGYLYVFAYLHDETYSVIIDDYEFWYFSEGATTLGFTYDGARINASDRDGPYYVDLAIVNPNSGSVLDRDVHVTAPYSYLDFETPSAALRPPHSDFGLDSNGNGLYDYLVLDANVSVNVAGSYYLSADLCASVNGSGSCQSRQNSSFLESGTWAVRFMFDGRQINASDLDGPYQVTIHLYDAGAWRIIDREEHSTAAYSHLDFETPQAAFAPPHTDTGQDIDGDGLFEFLVVRASINVTNSSWYRLEGVLHNGNHTLYITATNLSYFDPGSWAFGLSFDGSPINTTEIDGPYSVDLYLYDASTWSFLDSDIHATAGYSHTEFNGPGPHASFRQPHGDAGLDTDGDGGWNYLVVQANVAVRQAGTYCVSGDLRDASGAMHLGASNQTNLGTGINAVWLFFEGRHLNASGIDGPYFVDLRLYEWWYGCQYLDDDRHETAAYGHREFDGPPARFVAPHEEYGIDTDGDGRYNNLVVDATVETEFNGTLYVTASLYRENGTNGTNDTGYLNLYASNTSFLSPGSHAVRLTFDGTIINASGVDGPYRVDLWLGGWDFFDNDTFRTRAYAHTDFEEPPHIESVQTGVRPTIDGTFSTGEWDDAAVVDLSTVPGNQLAGFLYVKDDNQVLYIAYDVTGDTFATYYDMATIAFDTGNDGNYTDGQEDFFLQRAGNPADQYHFVWSNNSGWMVEDSPYDQDLPNHEGLASAAGFAASPNGAVRHRIYEFAIPFALLAVEPGDTIGFEAGSPYGPGVFDDFAYRWSSWPYSSSIPLWMYGDLALSRDTTPPSVAVTSPDDRVLLSGNEVDVRWDASDLGLGLERIELSVDGGAPIVLGPETTTSQLTLVDGDHTVTVTAYDRAGNSRSVEVTITIDTTAPETAFTSPDSRAVLAAGDVILSWTASDATSGIDHFELSLDGEAPIVVPAALSSYTLTELGDGSHRVTLTAIDRAEHSVSVSIIFTVDTVAPTLAVSAPTSDSIITSSSVAVSWIALDLGSGAARIEVGLDETSPVILPASAASHTFTGVGDGTHAIRVAAFDLGGNMQSVSTAVMVDTTPPDLRIVSPSDGATLTTGTVRVAWTASDVTSGLRRHTLSLDGGAPLEVSADILAYTFADLRDGAHMIALTGYDRAGNVVTVTSTFSVDTGVFSPSGPYGSTPLVGVAIVAVAALVSAGLWLRVRRKRLPPPGET